MDTTLAAASSSRKERLEALRRRKDGDSAENEVPLVFKQRNYDPETRTLKKRTIIDENGDTVEKEVEGLAERIIREDEERRAQDLDLFNIVPKRPNWDLKRDLNKKLGRLQRKTDTAIHALIRQRLAAQSNQVDGGELAASVNAQAKADQEDDDDSDED